MPVLISGRDFSMIQKVYAEILNIFIFRPFLAGQRSNLAIFLSFGKILTFDRPKKAEQSKVSKSPILESF